jgi:hypothetical protein
MPQSLTNARSRRRPGSVPRVFRGITKGAQSRDVRPGPSRERSGDRKTERPHQHESRGLTRSVPALSFSPALLLEGSGLDCADQRYPRIGQPQVGPADTTQTQRNVADPLRRR